MSALSPNPSFFRYFVRQDRTGVGLGLGLDNFYKKVVFAFNNSEGRSETLRVATFKSASLLRLDEFKCLNQ